MMIPHHPCHFHRHIWRSLALLLLLLVTVAGAEQPVAAKCVQLYYDRAYNASPDYTFGRIHTLMLQNLLGHFPHIEQRVSPIEKYRAGDLDRCEASIYLGTYFNNAIPEAFYSDYVNTRKSVAWAGYNIWNVPSQRLRQLFPVAYRSISTLDRSQTDPQGMPGFYRFFEYKGEEFIKYAGYDRNDPSRFLAAFELTLWNYDPDEVDLYVVSWARHSSTGNVEPYILRNGNHWYIGDSPFAFATEEDRYLIMADLLFDILGEAPRRPQGPGGKRPAFLRVEDIHPIIPMWQLRTLSEMLHRERVKYVMSIIPIFTDPLRSAVTRSSDMFVPMTSRPDFTAFLRDIAQSDARIVYHGITHQHGTTRNPFTGMSGDDFEFWDRVTNAPLPEDGPSYVVPRIEDGLSLIEASGLSPVAWLTPHYQASPIDYKIFSQLFTWNIGRVIYFPAKFTGERSLPSALRIDRCGRACNSQRLPYFQSLTSSYPSGMLPTGQFFPYEIYGDYYGQRLIPENVGNVQPYLNEQVLATRTVDDLLKIMKRNRVLRDVWGSLFVHPFEIDTRTSEGTGNFPGDAAEIQRLITEARNLGYEFIDIGDWIRTAGEAVRPNVIEVE